MVNDRQSLDLTTFAHPAGGGAVEWRISEAPVPYPEAIAAMEARVAAIAAGEAPELVWLLEHPPLYTSGTSGKAGDLLDARFPLFATGRGGQLTYHGPGQRVAYVMLDLKRAAARRAGLCGRPRSNGSSARCRRSRYGASAREDRVGVWVKRPDKGAGFEDKIAAIGVRLRRWVSFHGIAINVEPDLTHFDGDRALRRGRPALWRHQPRRSRPSRDHGGRRYRAPAGIRGAVWRRETAAAGSDRLVVVVQVVSPRGSLAIAAIEFGQTVGSTENRSPASLRSSASERAGSSRTASTRAEAGPRWHSAKRTRCVTGSECQIRSTRADSATHRQRNLTNCTAPRPCRRSCG